MISKQNPPSSFVVPSEHAEEHEKERGRHVRVLVRNDQHEQHTECCQLADVHNDLTEYSHGVTSGEYDNGCLCTCHGFTLQIIATSAPVPSVLNDWAGSVSQFHPFTFSNSAR